MNQQEDVKLLIYSMGVMFMESMRDRNGVIILNIGQRLRKANVYFCRGIMVLLCMLISYEIAAAPEWIVCQIDRFGGDRMRFSFDITFDLATAKAKIIHTNTVGKMEAYVGTIIEFPSVLHFEFYQPVYLVFSDIGGTSTIDVDRKNLDVIYVSGSNNGAGVKGTGMCTVKKFDAKQNKI